MSVRRMVNVLYGAVAPLEDVGDGVLLSLNEQPCASSPSHTATLIRCSDMQLLIWSTRLNSVNHRY